MTPGGGATYGINVPVQVYGKENLDRIAEAISQTSQRVRISAVDFNTWKTVMGQASDQGFTLSTSIGMVEKAMWAAGRDVAAFTDRLRANIREQEALQATSGRTSAVLGRIAGRVGGAELLGQGLGIPGGGFIGSQLFQSLGISGGAALAGGAVALGGTAAYGLYKMVEETSKYAQEQVNLSKELGITTTQTQILGRVTEVTGVQTNSMFQVLKAMNRELTESGPKSQAISKSLHELGLTAGIAFKQPYDQLMDLLGAMSKLDQASRERVAVNLLGESQSAGGFSGRSLLALVDSYQGDIQSVKNSGVLISEETIGRMAQLRKESELLKQTWEGIAHNAALFVEGLHIPAITLGALMNAFPELRSLAGGEMHEFNVGRATFSNPALNAAMFSMFPGLVNGTSPSPAPVGPRPPVVDAAELGRRMIGVQAANAGQFRLDDAARLQEVGMTPIERLKFREKQLETKQSNSLEAYKMNRGSREDYLEVRNEVESNKAAIKRQEDYDRQQTEFGHLRPTDEMSYEEMASELRSFDQKFSLILRSPKVRQRRQELQRGSLISQNAYLTQHTISRSDQFLKMESGAILYGLKEGTREEDEIVNSQLSGVRNSDKVARGQMQSDTVSEKLRALNAGGYSKSGMTPMDIARRELANALGTQSDAVKGTQLGSEITSRTNALGELRGLISDKAGDARERLQAEIDERKLDIGAAQTDLLLKSVEALHKFNEAVDHNNEAMRSNFAGGFASVVMGAQKGGAKGLTGAIRGFLESQEQTVLKNIGGDIYGQGGPLHAKSGTALGKILTGTIFGPIEKRKDPAEALVRAADKLDKAADHLMGVGGTGTGGASGSGITVGSGSTTDTGITVNDSVSGAAGTLGEVGNLASTAATLSTVTKGATSQNLKAVAGTLSKLDSVLKGTKYTGNIPKIASGTLGGWEEAGAIAGTAAAGLGVYEGIATAAKGGAKNISGGIAGALGAAVPFALMAGPVAGAAVAAAAAVAGLVSSFLPDPRQARAEQISKSLFTNQYQAPQSITLNESNNGGYSDYDIHGNVRQSTFSPYPVLSNAYLDVPRRTVVPGHTISSFGGYSGTPSAGVYPQSPRVNGNANAPAFHLTVVAMDAGSIIDRADHIADALHRAIRNEGHALVNTIGQQLGIRN